MPFEQTSQREINHKKGQCQRDLSKVVWLESLAIRCVCVCVHELSQGRFLGSKNMCKRYKDNVNLIERKQKLSENAFLWCISR